MYLHVLYRAKFEVNIIIKKWISCFYIHPIINLLTDMNKAKMGKWNADSKFTSYSGTIYMIEVIGSIPMFTSLHKNHTYSWYGWIVFWDWLFWVPPQAPVSYMGHSSLLRSNEGRPMYETSAFESYLHVSVLKDNTGC